MGENERWTIKCQDTADGTGDVIVDLPPELLARLSLGLISSEIIWLWQHLLKRCCGAAPEHHQLQPESNGSTLRL